MKTKKLIETARTCASKSGHACYVISHDSDCPYNTKEACLDCLLTDIADRLEELNKRDKARKASKIMHLADSNLSVGFCPECGEGVNSEMYFCSKCGQKLKWEIKE